MKKLIALLLALMMALVCVSALAADGDGAPTGTTPATESGEGGDNTETTPSTPAATSAATATDPSVDTGYNEVSAPKTGLNASTTNDVIVKKEIKISGTGANIPTQTVSFTVKAGTVTGSSATAPAVTIDSVTFTEVLEGKGYKEDQTKEVTIKLPAYSSVGVYTYPVEETDTNVAGMKYATNLELKVTVINGESGLVIAGIALRQNDVKTDTMENDYVANALTVGKTVDGNLGDKSKVFPITVTLKAPSNDKVYGTVGVTIDGDKDTTVKEGTKDIKTAIAAEKDGWTEKTLALTLKDGQTVKFDNLPDGVIYTVVENNTIKHLNSDLDEPENAQAYKVDDEVTKETELKADKTVTIKNTKNIEVDTGVALDSTVYMLIMALALVGFVALKVRRREEY